MASFRARLFSSLVVLPTTNALGHLAPAVGACWTAVDMPVWDVPVLVLLFSVHALLDSYDKYRDMSSAARPTGAWWYLWTGTLSLMIVWSAHESGFSTAIRLVWYLGLEVLWAGPLIPIYSPKRGFEMVKLKQVLGPLKSVFCGVMAGLMDSAPAALHACMVYPQHCTSDQKRMQALLYSILYNFIRETTYDTRDIDEDTHEGITTLATALGMTGTMLVLTIAAVVGELWIGGYVSTAIAPSPNFLFSGEVIGRALVTVGLSSWVAKFPRESRWIWVPFSLLSLAPAWHAQAATQAGSLQ